MTSQTFTVSGMTCQHCVIQVQALLSCIDGVQNISVSLSPPRVYVEGSRVDATVLSSALSSTRFSINTLTKTEEKGATVSAKPIIITIDGPTASGKGAVAQLLAQHLGFSYLDSGALYRIIALLAIRSGLALKDNIGKDKENELVKLTQTLPITFSQSGILLDGQELSNELRTENVGNMASKIAVINPLRESLLKRQRDFACLPGLVADGRDMGTVVFPDAPIKLFLTASSQIRAERRYKQLIEKNIPANMANLVADLNERDARDSHRELAPLKAAHGAYVLDSSQLTLDETVAETLKYYAKIMG